MLVSCAKPEEIETWLRYAKENGARTVGITDSQASPYYGVADVCLFAKSEMVSFLDSLVAPLSLGR